MHPREQPLTWATANKTDCRPTILKNLQDDQEMACPRHMLPNEDADHGRLLPSLQIIFFLQRRLSRARRPPGNRV
jgi:hypothetical protein